MASRRERRLKRLKERRREGNGVQLQAESTRTWSLYRDGYRKLLFIPLLLLLLAIGQIAYQVATTGDFLNKGVTLSGGLTLTVPVKEEMVTVQQVELLLEERYPEEDILVRGISDLGTLRGIVVEAGVQDVERLEEGILDALSTILPDVREEYSVEIVGPSLGAAFFRQTLTAMAIAFLLMGMVVFLYFGQSRGAKYGVVALTLVTAGLVFSSQSALSLTIATILGLGLIYLYVRYSLPSAAVILAALSDIVMTLAVVNILGIKVSSAGIAAFLMLIGYSVDTDILLSTRVLKRTNGTVYSRVLSSLGTGMTMMVTSIIAALIGFLVSESATIKEIMLIILIGLIADIINTWLQNAAIIRIFAERQGLQ